MEDVASVVEAVDSWLAIFAITIIGGYAIIWKYGRDILRALASNKQVSQEALTVATDVQQSIITNHDSKNLGDAVDRLTEMVMTHMEASAAGYSKMRELEDTVCAVREDLNAHMVIGARRMAEVNTVLKNLIEDQVKE